MKFYTQKFLKKMLLGLFMATSMGMVAADVVPISGVVKDSQGEPLPGVTVRVKGTNTVVATDLDGKFQIRTEPGKTLQFSYIGFEQKNEAAKNGMDVTMSNTDTALDEVVVVGYGTVKKANLVGAVDQIDSKLIAERGHSNISRALQGQIPGLNITLTDGKPSRGSTVNVRGTGSIGQGGNALVLIDGVVSDMGSVNPADVESVSVLKDASSAAIYGARGAFGVVLVTTKKAKSGKAKVTYSGSVSLNDRMNKWEDWTESDPVKWYDRFQEAYNGYYGKDATGINNVFPINNGYRDRLADPSLRNLVDPNNPYVGLSPNGKAYEYYGENNWFNEFYKKSAWSTEHNVAVSGGNDVARFYVSGRYSYTDGIYRVGDQWFKNYNTRARGEVNISKTVKFENITSLTIKQSNEPIVLYDDQLPLRMIQHQGYPMQMAKNPDGTWTEFGVYTGYAGFIEGSSWRKDKITYTRNQSALTWEPLKDELIFKGDFTWWHKGQKKDTANNQIEFYTGPTTKSVRGSFSKLDYYTYNTEYYSFNATANYIPKFENKDHYLNILVGWNVEHQHYNWYRQYRRGNISPDKFSFNLMDSEFDGTNIALGENGNEWAYAGALFRVDYNYKGKYLAEVSGRYDGSSRFPSYQQWGFFPSGSLAWRFTEEKFMESTRNWFSNGKLRASIGSLGNGNASPYSFMSLVSPGKTSVLIDGNKQTYAYTPGLVPSGLTWERSTTYDVGLDLDFLNYRLSFQGDYYIRRTTDMYTVGPTLPEVLGASSPKGNYADMRTNGWELSLTWRDHFDLGGKPFNYSVKAMVWDYYSTITKFNNATNKVSDYYVGKRVGEIWGYHVEGLYRDADQVKARTTGTIVGDYDYTGRGVNQATVAKAGNTGTYLPGDLMYADINGDGVVNTGANTLEDPGDRRVIGNSNPRYQFGFTLSADWNGFGISAFFQGVGKRNWYPTTEAGFFWGKYGRVYGYDLLAQNESNMWSEDNLDAYWPRLRSYVALNSNQELSTVNDRYLQNLAYVRLKNLQIDYSFNKKVCDALHMQSLRVYLQGENLFTASPFFKHCKTMDPEGTSNGDSDYSTDANRGAGVGYPLMRQYTFGLSVTF